MTRLILIVMACCSLIPWAGAALAEDAGREVIWVETFDREFINWATPHVGVFQFPEADHYRFVNCHMEISCPTAPGDCDPWDRFGKLSLRKFEADSTYVDYEIARFITPYDITFSGGPGTCSWICDVSDYQFLLHDEVTLVLYIESWMGDNRGWNMTIDFEMITGTPGASVPYDITRLWTFGNLIYGDPDNPYEDHLQPVAVTMPAQANGAKFKAFSTGHGFWNTDNAAEFSYKWQGISADEFYEQHYLWRDDCAENPCSPQGGTWEYNRAGWCPGDKADPWDVDLSGTLIPGQESVLDFVLQPYENWCRPNNPECVDETGCTCDGHAYYKFEGQVIWYRDPTATAVDDDGAAPNNLRVMGNHPNPFNPSTTIEYGLAAPGEVTISIYDAAGARVRTVIRNHEAGGDFAWTWNGRDGRGGLLPAGVYLYEVSSGEQKVSAKMLMLK